MFCYAFYICNKTVIRFIFDGLSQSSFMIVLWKWRINSLVYDVTMYCYSYVVGERKECDRLCENFSLKL